MVYVVCMSETVVRVQVAMIGMHGGLTKSHLVNIWESLYALHMNLYMNLK